MTLTSCGGCNWRGAVGGPKLRHVVVVEVLLYVHRNRRFIKGREPRTATSTFTQLLSFAEARSLRAEVTSKLKNQIMGV